ncbi:nitrilase-related carbon-nitrogen hydrolase [Janthinobacterium lividum]|uniref:Nitrilase-related carbon-nitrogen hydrolase n=1 Tax=Janthinobacterium lividum TaxID=29581 RepID=A0ABU0XWE7_9BURK|nr:nitrilase-related carbon-nitrogen hydrolase [Janthinobacterium lividum]MDQ4627884.1 nitrilase-related carbon-nitrogen hydrolase [Janthinobacterium lividum]MDQ4676702.1 nitrilase-related carbon-nitrogen hydrolase [Janthinobacterium lividum]MDQ4686826.1 nitrilase-related carbon-nitrogen hydrolase [Janthinobacterium lividum]
MSMFPSLTTSAAGGTTLRQRLLQTAAALAAGLPLHWVLGPQPLGWLAWCAPLPVLWLALRSSRRDAAWMTFLAAVLGLSSNFAYFRLLMPLPAVLAVIAVKALLWLLVVLAARRLVLRYRAPWTVLAYPVLWVAIDTLMAALLPDGNWGSLAYSQADNLAVLQVAALAGVPGLLFLLCLAPSALALLLAGGRAYAPAASAAVLLLAVAFAGGAWRVQGAPALAPAGPLAGLVAIDDFIGPATPPARTQAIWDQYARHVEELAGQGARLVLLPEKIAVLAPAQADAVQQRFQALARSTGVWITLGLGVQDAAGRRNLAWLFAPDGAAPVSYQKHHLAPPEREFLAGSAYAVQPVAGMAMGLAICKDMHFAPLGQAYGAAGAQAMLVPAWDFQLDAWMGARMTVVRGVENGYAVLRAAREGVLTVSDAYGRVLAERASSAMPGSTLLAPLQAHPSVATWAGWLGPLFGWLCVALGVILLCVGRRAAPAS